MNAAVDSLLKNHRLGERVLCSSCRGSGFLPDFAHIAKGRCFKCGGQGHCPKYPVRRVVRRRRKPTPKPVVVNAYKGLPWSDQLRLRAYDRALAERKKG